MLNYIKKDDAYYNSTKTNYYSETKEMAVSYNHWCYLLRINGTLVFNNYNYSPTTCKHQRDTQAMLQNKDYVSINSPKGLHNLDSAVEYYRFEIEELVKAMANPRSRASTNERRKKAIEGLEGKLEILASLGVEV